MKHLNVLFLYHHNGLNEKIFMNKLIREREKVKLIIKLNSIKVKN